MSVQHIALVPRDGVFCKDGRGWHTSASGRGHSLDWPWPSTVLGALRTAWGRQEEQRLERRFERDEWRAQTSSIALGPTVTLRRRHGEEWSAEHAVWPVPADALWTEGATEVTRLRPSFPLAPTMGRDEDDVREKLLTPAAEDAAKPLPSPRWWSHSDYIDWLAGRSVGVRTGSDTVALSRRLQVHVGVDPGTLTAKEGVLFSHDVVETLESEHEWAIGAEVHAADAEMPPIATLGADGRVARVERLPHEVFAPPPTLLEAFGGGSRGVRLMAVTPLCFKRGWLPDGIDRQGDQYRGRLGGLEFDVVLRSAVVPRPVHISGWDIAAGTPKPTARMVAPGAVYFFERADGEVFGVSDARSLWLAALGNRTDDGFGRIVPGEWTPGKE